MSMGFLRVLITLFYTQLLYLSFIPFATSVYFKITSFGANTNEIQYRGSAVPSSGAVQLNPVNYVCQTGQAIYSEPVQMWDSSSGKVSDFTTHFSFTITTDSTTTASYGDGFAFFLGPVDFQIPPNSAGSFLGLYNLSSYRESSQNQMIHVEFDSFVDDDWDPSFEHVGINKNSIFSANATAWNAGNHSGDVAEVIVSYSAASKMLVMSLTYNTLTPPETSSLSYQLDLKEVLGEWATMGFSAGTGNLKEKNAILYWEFNSSLNGKWPGTQEKSCKSSKSSYILPVAIGVAIGAFVCIIAMGVFKFLKKKGWIKVCGKKVKEPMPEEITLIRGYDTESEPRPAPRNYPLSDIIFGTNDFSDDNKLGEGGSGCVYKGRLPVSVNQEVAVKKILECSAQGKKEFSSEVEIISKLNHPNLVQLRGWCAEQDKYLVIYDFMPKGSLDSYLFGDEGPLDWPKRYKIAQGLASAIQYLHEKQGERYVIHRDIKPSNVMLDSEFNAKLGDFGLARIVDNNEQGSKTANMAGTFLYCAPEYLNGTHKASKVTDMYSFGVTLLEIGSGKSVATPNFELVKWAWDLYGKKELGSTVDKRLSGIYNEKEYNCLMMVGLSCTHSDQSKRSTIEKVIHALENVIPPVDMPITRHDMLTNEASSSGNT